MNPLFIVMNQTDTNSPGEINLQLSFQISYFGDCYLEYGLGAECVNLNMSKTIAVHGNVAMVNFTLTNNGIYCYQINCNSTIAQGTINYQGELYFD